MHRKGDYSPLSLVVARLKCAVGINICKVRRQVQVITYTMYPYPTLQEIP
jgi:hypothetical protein